MIFLVGEYWLKEFELSLGLFFGFAEMFLVDADGVLIQVVGYLDDVAEGWNKDVGVGLVGGDDDEVFTGFKGVEECVDLVGDVVALTVVFNQDAVEMREQFALHLGQESFYVFVGNGSFVGEPAVVGAEVCAQAFGWFGFVGLGGKMLARAHV